MIWIGKNLLGPKKKWNKDGSPHPDYWQGGFFGNLTSETVQTDRIIYEIKPVKGCKSVIGAITKARSLELLKVAGTNEIRILATADKSDESWPHETGHEVIQLDESISESFENKDTVGVDFELARQLNFAIFDKDIPHILNSFASVISQFESSDVWLQVVWEDMTDIFEPILDEAIIKIEEQKEKYEKDKEIIEQYLARQGQTMIGFSIRCIISSPDPKAVFDALQGVAKKIVITNDYLMGWYYHGPSMLKWMESREVCSQAVIDILASNASNMWEKSRLGIDKDLSAVLIASVQEFGRLFQILDDPDLPLQQMRQRRGGATPMRTGFALDSTKYGMITESPASIDPNILDMHTYILGATGSGKTALIRTYIKHLEIGNEQGIYSSAIIYVDVKSHDSIDCFKQCEKNTDVMIFDVNDNNFALNLLELPNHTPKNRDAVISRTVGHVLEVFKEIHSQQQTYVQLERVMRLLLHYLYANEGTPTLIDLYTLILELQKKTDASMNLITQVYTKTTVPEMEESIKALKAMSRDSWTALINRVEPFIIEKHLRIKYGIGLNTVNFDEIIKPGKITIFRIAEAETPPHIHKMISTIIVMRIWEAVLGRDESEKTPVTLFLDEFHTMAEMKTVKTMLSRARSFGLGLVLAHQNLQQISDEMVDTIVGNTATQLYGRISGTSAAKIARIVEPTDAIALTEKLSSQPNYTFMHASIPKQGQERQPPFAINIAPPPGLIRDTLPVLKPLPESNEMPIERMRMSRENNWVKQAPHYIPTKEEWDLILAIQYEAKSMREAAIVSGIPETTILRNVLDSLIERNIVQTETVMTTGKPTMCSLTDLAKEQYFSEDWSIIGTAKDVAPVANYAIAHYIAKGMFVCIARQGGRISGGQYIDLVVYDYKTKMATSVEIESVSEVNTHPEHVIYNMKKWPEMGFSNCHVWSMSKKIVELRKRVPDALAKKVKCFLVDEDGKFKEELVDKTE